MNRMLDNPFPPANPKYWGAYRHGNGGFVTPLWPEEAAKFARRPRTPKNGIVGVFPTKQEAEECLHRMVDEIVEKLNAKRRGGVSY